MIIPTEQKKKVITELREDLLQVEATAQQPAGLEEFQKMVILQLTQEQVKIQLTLDKELITEEVTLEIQNHIQHKEEKEVKITAQAEEAADHHPNHIEEKAVRAVPEAATALREAAQTAVLPVRTAIIQAQADQEVQAARAAVHRVQVQDQVRVQAAVHQGNGNL